MKKFVLLLIVAAFAVGSLTSTAEAAPHGKGLQVRHLQKANHRLHKKVRHLRHKLHGKNHK